MVKKSKPRGRPPKRADKRASKNLHFRVTQDHAETIQKAAEMSGLGVSGWIRDRLLKAARRELR